MLGVNTVDKMTGYVSFSGDLNANGKVDQNELVTVPGSLLGKAATAQAVFGSKFAQPEAPTAPTFYLIPGDRQVTVLWLPSPSETQGDNYFITAQDPLTYDPNYREKDVMGYRVYRGNNQDPSTFRMLAQFNYNQGPAVIFTDHTGQIKRRRRNRLLAPDLGIFLSCDDAGLVNGVNTIDPIDHDVVAEGGLVQGLTFTALLDGNALTTTADTALTGRGNNVVCGAGRSRPARRSTPRVACRSSTSTTPPRTT